MGTLSFTVKKKNLARDCNRCHHIESPAAGTLFHRQRFGIRKAFMISFEIECIYQRFVSLTDIKTIWDKKDNSLDVYAQNQDGNAKQRKVSYERKCPGR